MSNLFEDVEFSDNRHGAKMQRALIAKFSVICAAKGCDKKRSEAHVAYEKKRIEEGKQNLTGLQEAFQNPTYQICEGCFNRLWKLFKPIELKDGKTIQKKTPEQRKASAKVAKEKARPDKTADEDRNSAE